MTLHDAPVLVPLFVAVLMFTVWMAVLYVKEIDRNGRQQESERKQL